MKLSEGGSHHLATNAADFIDELRDRYGDDAELTGFVLIAEVCHETGGEWDSSVRWKHGVTWAHAVGMMQAGLAGELGVGGDD